MAPRIIPYTVCRHSTASDRSGSRIIEGQHMRCAWPCQICQGQRQDHHVWAGRVLCTHKTSPFAVPARTRAGRAALAYTQCSAAVLGAAGAHPQSQANAGAEGTGRNAAQRRQPTAQLRTHVGCSSESVLAQLCVRPAGTGRGSDTSTCTWLHARRPSFFLCHSTYVVCMLHCSSLWRSRPRGKRGYKRCLA